MSPTHVPAARWGLVALGLAVLLLLPAPARSQAGPVRGTLALPRGADVMLVDAASGQERTLTPEGDALISSVAWSPDGTRLAAARSSRPPGEVAYGQDIDVIDAQSGGIVSSIQRGQPGVILESPSWTPDGQWILYERQETVRFGIQWRVERARPDGTERSTVIDGGHAPAVSPTGSLLAFVRSEPVDALSVSHLSGEDERVVVPAGRFLLMAYPRFSPDGEWIAFVTVTDPWDVQPQPTPARPGVVFALGWSPPPAAPLRHGIPWDVWTVRADGRDLHPVRLAEDDPSIAWSPDGDQLAIYGGRGLGLLKLNGEVEPFGPDMVGFGGIAWKP